MTRQVLECGAPAPLSQKATPQQWLEFIKTTDDKDWLREVRRCSDNPIGLRLAAKTRLVILSKTRTPAIKLHD